jgi:hypothetical protein
LATKHAILIALVNASSITKHSNKKLDYWKCIQGMSPWLFVIESRWDH